MPGDKGPEVADLETVKILMHAFPVAGGGCKLILGVGKVVQNPLDVTMAYDPPKLHPIRQNLIL